MQVSARMRLIDTVDNKEGVDVYGTGDHSEHTID